VWFLDCINPLSGGILEHCVKAWGPYLRQDIDTLERIQAIAAKTIRGLAYEERLMRCGLSNLEKEEQGEILIEEY